MLGWINDCVEKLVIEKFGVDAWHIIKQKAGCNVPDNGFYKMDHYTDKSTIDLVVAASDVSNLSVDTILEVFGRFFTHYIRKEGYDNLLCCQGSTLKDWMANINAIHQHLQTTFPKKMIMPQFWCEDASDGTGALILHYYSKRGNHLAPLAKGLVIEVAEFQFHVKIDMKLTELQGENGAGFTSWYVTSVDPNEMWKLTQSTGMREGKKNAPTALKCPFTGMTVPPPMKKISSSASISSMVSSIDDHDDDVVTLGTMKTSETASYSETAKSRQQQQEEKQEQEQPQMDSEDAGEIGLSSTVTKKLFPYHIIMNNKFEIVQVGQALLDILVQTSTTTTTTSTSSNSEEQQSKDYSNKIIGSHIGNVLEITQPMNVEWNWTWMRKLEDQSFHVEPSFDTTGGIGSSSTSSSSTIETFKLKASVVLISHSPPKAMIIMAPDANNLDELRDMNLTLSDLPVHGDYRDAIFLREHLSHQMNNALKMEKLSKSLTREKELLESLLPEHAAEGLRNGKTVEPMLHPKTTFFFSDIVGFTNICQNLYPWDVIDMLNRLYCVMDFLAMKFSVFKVETIGDAYVCCSGLPEANDKHALNVANFAVAVNHCCQQVLSPTEKKPIQLRIGIHSGSCASGVVGMTNPRYCVFGDTVNTCARHESTGEPGKIHCSRTTKVQLELLRRRTSSSHTTGGKKLFTLQERGLVDMKGKGKQLTYWLTGSEDNGMINTEALQKLDVEVKALLAKTDFDAQSSRSKAAAAALKDAVAAFTAAKKGKSAATSTTSSSSSSSSPPPQPSPPTPLAVLETKLGNEKLEDIIEREVNKRTVEIESRIRSQLVQV